jgi:hypothetical protein
VGKLRHPRHELGHGGAAVSLGQIVGFTVADQLMIDQRQPVPDGFDALPHSQLFGRRQLIKSAGFHRGDQISESRVQGIEGLIYRRALFALSRRWIPEFHASILFENMFANKLFYQGNKEKVSGQILHRPG